MSDYLPEPHHDPSMEPIRYDPSVRLPDAAASERNPLHQSALTIDELATDLPIVFINTASMTAHVAIVRSDPFRWSGPPSPQWIEVSITIKGTVRRETRSLADAGIVRYEDKGSWHTSNFTLCLETFLSLASEFGRYSVTV